MSYRIPFNHAVQYIESFIENFEDVATNQALGGTILKDRIDGAADEGMNKYTGNMAWYCYEKSKLFISFEENNDYVDEVEVEEPQRNSLRCPSVDSIFRYEGGDVRSMLLNHQPQLGDPIDMSISKTDVIEMKERFLKHPDIGSQNTRPYCFFENQNHLDIEYLISDPKVKYVRYYFGYIKGHDVNQIRLVLFGADENGKTLTPKKLSEVNLLNGDAAILQTSWPPRT